MQRLYAVERYPPPIQCHTVRLAQTPAFLRASGYPRGSTRTGREGKRPRHGTISRHEMAGFCGPLSRETATLSRSL